MFPLFCYPLDYYVVRFSAPFQITSNCHVRSDWPDVVLFVSFSDFSNIISFSQINGLCWIYQNLYDVQFQTLLHPSSCRSFQILQLVVKKCSSFTFQCSYKFESESFLDIPSLINHHYLQSIPLTQTSGAILHTPITMVEEFLHSNIHLRVKLGSGNFGDVYQGEILHNKQEVNS